MKDETTDAEPYIERRCARCYMPGWLRGPDCFACWRTAGNQQRPCRYCGKKLHVHYDLDAGDCPIAYEPDMEWVPPEPPETPRARKIAKRREAMRR